MVVIMERFEKGGFDVVVKPGQEEEGNVPVLQKMIAGARVRK